MSVLLPVGDMTRDQILDCSYHALAIVSLCQLVTKDAEQGDLGADAGRIATALDLAGDLMRVVHGALSVPNGG